MSDIQFIAGMNFKAPNEKAPEYVKAKGWIKNAELIDFLKARIAAGHESTNFDLKVSQGGKYYAAVDDWKPQGSSQDKPARKAPTNDDFHDDSLPF
jgi:hypothetical protein